MRNVKHVFLSSKFCVCARIVLNVMREIAERYVQRQQRYVLEFRVHYFGTCESFAEETQESSHLKKQGRRATRQVPFPPEGTPATQSAGFPPVPPRPTERARGPFYPLFRSNPPQRGGGHEKTQEPPKRLDSAGMLPNCVIGHELNVKYFAHLRGPSF